ncbi:MAG: hypothetical protein H7842_14770, partial [Gammaproteobacteria bacterium SHHR-1]
VEVRGIPLAYEAVFTRENIDGSAFLSLRGVGLKSYSEEDISNFFKYLKIARSEALLKLI